MIIRIGNVFCFWGVEFVDDLCNFVWCLVLKDCVDVGYKGIEFGFVGYMFEDLVILVDVLVEYDLELIGGVVFCVYYDLVMWDDVLDVIYCMVKVLKVYGVQYLVLIDLIFECCVLIVGCVSEVEQMDKVEWIVYCDCIVEIVRIGVEEYGLIVGIYVYVVGFMDFELEFECLLNEVDEKIFKICFDIGYYFYVGFDLVVFMKCYVD